MEGAAGAIAGFALGAPTLRVRGDYLAIVTLGFGEIVKDVLVNLDTITKGTQGINPLPPPSFLGTPLESRGRGRGGVGASPKMSMERMATSMVANAACSSASVFRISHR